MFWNWWKPFLYDFQSWQITLVTRWLLPNPEHMTKIPISAHEKKNRPTPATTLRNVSILIPHLGSVTLNNSCLVLVSFFCLWKFRGRITKVKLTGSGSGKLTPKLNYWKGCALESLGSIEVEQHSSTMNRMKSNKKNIFRAIWIMQINQPRYLSICRWVLFAWIKFK